MFAYDASKNFNLSKVAHSIGLEGSVSTPTATYALPWVQNFKSFVSAGMQGLGQLSTWHYVAIGAGILFLASGLAKRKARGRRRSYIKKVLP